MAKKKTSAEKAREDAENEKVENMLDGAFGTLSGLETNKPEESSSEIETVDELEVEPEENENPESVASEEEKQVVIPEADDGHIEENADNASEEDLPESEKDEKILPSLPESAPPSGPPSKGPPSGPPSKGPPSGPPSKGPPSGPPSNEEPIETINDSPVEETPVEVVTDDLTTEVDTPLEIVEEDSESKENVTGQEEEIAELESDEAAAEEVTEQIVEEPVENLNLMEEAEILPEDQSTPIEENESLEVEESNAYNDEETEAEIARLSAEVERLRRSMAGAAEVIEELENPPMPPAVMDNLVIGAHIVGDMARLARQLDREQLIRASMGTIAMLHPEQLEFIVSTKHMSLLPRMDERDICAAKLGVDPPRGAPTDWRVLEVVLASVSLITGGPAAVIHSHGPFTTAASCEKDLVLVQPIDEIGKKHIGKIIIVDPDDDNPEEFLRQVAEALQQGGMRCVVIRGKGAYAVGADLDQAWANAAMLEHSMKIVLLARQANLKV